MHDDIADIDQHPVAGRQAFDLGLAVAGFLERADDVIGQGADMAVRAARRDDEGVGDRGLALQVDADDILRLVVIELIDDQGFQRLKAFGGGSFIVGGLTVVRRSL
jgi:hypothetical protein